MQDAWFAVAAALAILLVALYRRDTTARRRRREAKQRRSAEIDARWEAHLRALEASGNPSARAHDA